jgi:hypothetical protein
MPVPDNEQFERYLREFRPVIPDALCLEGHVRNKKPYHFLASTAAAAAVFIVLIVFIWSHAETNHSAKVIQDPIEANKPVDATRPFSLGDANTLLAGTPSFKEAIEALTWQAKPSNVSSGARSVLDVLSKEDAKL